MIQIRFYRKSELARLYFPQAKDGHTAVTNLKYWINRNPRLKAGLQALGDTKYSRLYTPQQVRLLFDILGEPDEIVV